MSRTARPASDRSTRTALRRSLCTGRPWLVWIAAACLAAPAARADEEGGLDWQIGPTTAPIAGDLAEIEVPDGYMVLDAPDTRRLMELLENPLSGQEVGTLAPASESVDWFVVFEWDPMGYVPDEDADESLDAEALLASIREGTEAANAERRERGWGTLEVVGWQEKPHYDPETHDLSWTIIGSANGERSVNRIVKLLGRRGVMTTTLVTSPEVLPVASAEMDQLLGGYRFQPGHTYAEYVPGTDKLAQVGLGALVVGGTGAALIQSGLLARVWKGLVAIVAAIGAGIARLFGRNRDADPAHVG